MNLPHSRRAVLKSILGGSSLLAFSPKAPAFLGRSAQAARLGAGRPGHGSRDRSARRRQRRTEHRGPPRRRPLRQEPPDPSLAGQPAARDRLAARLPPPDGGVLESLQRGPAECRARCGVSQPARGPLRVDEHLADRRSDGPLPDRVDRPGYRPPLPPRVCKVLLLRSSARSASRSR